MNRVDGYIDAVLQNGWHEYGGRKSYLNSWLVNYDEAAALYAHNGIAQRMISLPADEALRRGWKVKAGEDIAVETKKRLASVYEDLAGNQQLSLALSWDRLFGGAVILMVADDGGTLEEPLIESRLRRIERLDVYAPKDVSFASSMVYADPTSPNYGKPQWYNIVGLYGNAFLVHESRLLIMHGGPIPNEYRRMRMGWGGTVFEAAEQALHHYDNGLSLASMALGRLSQGILKLSGMADLLMSDEGEQQVRKRLHLIDMGRSLMNTLALDVSDEYDQKNLALAGVRDIIEQFEYSLAAATGIPATLLFGRDPAGQNSTGESDSENYYNLVEKLQQTALRPALVRLVDVISKCSEYGIRLPAEWYIKFEPLWNESEREEAERHKLEADAKSTMANAVRSLAEAQLLDEDEARLALAEAGYKIDASMSDLLTRPPG